MADEPAEKSGDESHADEAEGTIVLPGEESDFLTQLITRLDDASDQPIERGELREILLRAVSISESHAGPLPHPDFLRKYEELIPNGAERIMTMAELEQTHRHTREAREQTLIETAEMHDFTITKRGQSFGLGICVVVVLAAGVFALIGQPGLAALLMGLDLVALAAVFVAGRYLPIRSTSTDDIDVREHEKED